MHIVHSVQLHAPVAAAWPCLADLEWLATVNAFHIAARFQTDQRSGVGTRLIADHGFRWLPVTYPRLIRITHWEPCVRLGWVEFDEHFPKWLFPHSNQYRLRVVNAQTTRLTYELHGSIQLPGVGRVLEKLFEARVVADVVRRECATIKARVESTQAGCDFEGFVNDIELRG